MNPMRSAHGRRLFFRSVNTCTVQRSQDDIYFKNKAITCLIRSGDLSSALDMFDGMPIRDVVTYNLLISAYGRHGHAESALQCYTQMLSRGIKESAPTLSSVLSICTGKRFFREGVQIHCRVISLGFSSNLYIGTSLIDLYMQMGYAEIALVLFLELSNRSLATWNLVLRGLCNLGQTDEALTLFKQMHYDGFQPNGLSLSYLIGGCGKEMLFDEGRQLHCHVIKDGWEKSNIFIANCLVDFYSASLCLNDARKSFDSISAEDVISWNSIICVYALNGLLFDSLELFSRMQFWGKRPSTRSLVGFLNISSRTWNLQFGVQVHCLVLKLGFDQGDVHVQSAIIDMYGKCGEIEFSSSFLERLPIKSLVCYNSYMTSLLHCGLIRDTVELFGLMVDEGIGFDEVSLSTALKAMSIYPSGNLLCCKLLHGCAAKSGFESDVAVSSSLIDVYARLGCTVLSCKIFQKIPSPDIICFTSMINAYARNGMGAECLKMLKEITQIGLRPDSVTFLSVLNGCSHSGLVEEGRYVFYSMIAHFGIHPSQQHYSCMVDLFGRAGMVSEAEELLVQAPQKADCVMWSSLLRSCRVHMNETVGRRTAQKLMEFEAEDPAITLQVSSFFSEIGDYESSMQTRDIAIVRKVSRDIGCSLIEVNDRYR